MILVFFVFAEIFKIYVIPRCPRQCGIQFHTVLYSAEIDFALSKTMWNEIIKRGMNFFFKFSNLLKIDRTLKNLIDMDNTTMELQIAKRKVQKFQHKNSFRAVLAGTEWHISFNIFVKTKKNSKPYQQRHPDTARSRILKKNEAKNLALLSL